MDMKTDYYEDIQLLDSKVLWFWSMMLIASLIILPFLIPNYYIYMANYMAINIIVTVGLNILIGYTGQISPGHAGFFAIGAYMTVLSMTVLHLPFLLALVLAAMIAAFFGFILGLPGLRLEGPYLAIATPGFGMAITQVIGRWQIFGGRMGLEAPPLLICATLRLLHPGERQTAVLLDRLDCISPNHGSPKPDENNEAHDRFAPKDRWGIFFYAGFLFVEPMLEGLQRCGRDVTPDSFVKAMETLKDFQGIGPKITYGPNQRQRSRSFFLAKCVEGGACTYLGLDDIRYRRSGRYKETEEIDVNPGSVR